MEEFFKKLGKKVLILMAPWLLLFLVILFVVGNMLEAFQSFRNALSGAVAWAKDAGSGIVEGMEDFWEGLFDGDHKYEEDAMNEWNGTEAEPMDPNMTAIIYQTTKHQKERMDEGTKASNLSEEAWDQFNSSDHTMLSSEDMRHFLKHANELNNHMFEMEDIYYQYKEWGPVEDTENGVGLGTYHWEKDFPITNTTDDGIYKLVSRTKIEGEGEGSARRFAPVWQDYFAVGGLVAFDKGANKDNSVLNGNKWSTGDETEYDQGKKENATDTDAAKVNSLENYFLTKKDREKIQSIFDYQFSYLWDGVEKGKYHNTENTAYYYDDEEDKLVSGTEIGYRFRYKGPEPLSGDPCYAGEEHRYTMYVPESAPSSIHNSWQTYWFKYIDTSEVPADLGGWEGRGAPPEGEIICGRWVYENPAAFIFSIAELAPYYEKLSADEYYKEHHNTHTKVGRTEGYSWETEMIDHLCMYLDTLEIPADSSGRGIPSRTGYYTDRLDDYLAKKITIKYEGSSYDPTQMANDAELIKTGLMDQVYDLYVAHYKRIGKEEEEAQALAEEERAKWEERVDISYDTGAPFIKVNDEADNIPFPSYGVIYGTPGTGPTEGDWGAGDDYSFPDNYEYRQTGSFYIYSGGGYTPDRRFTYYEGATVDLRVPEGEERYTKEQLRAAMQYLQDKSGNKIPFASEESVEAVYQYGREHHADMMGVLAIIITEGGCNSSFGRNHYNFFNKKASDGEQFFTSEQTGSSHWADYKAMGYNPGTALLAQVGFVVNRYINASQPNFLLMSFNQYVSQVHGGIGPQSRKEAIAAQESPGYSHCYCPWWESAYVPGYVDEYEWANRCGQYYLQLRALAGIGFNPQDTTDDPDEYGVDTDEIPEEVLNQYPWLRVALSLKGTPYSAVNNNGPSSFDCSGFVSWCFEKSGNPLRTGRTSAAQYYAQIPRVSKSDARPGDIIYFENTTSTYKPGITHVGIYLGNGKFIHCSTKGGVKISTLNGSKGGWYRERVAGFGRN